MGYVLVSVFSTLCPPASFMYNVLAENERAGCFTFIVFLLSYGCNSSLSLPHGVMNWSAVCECGF